MKATAAVSLLLFLFRTLTAEAVIIWGAFDRRKTVVDTQMTGHSIGKWSLKSPIVRVS